jgi:exonuclease VII small subunit
MWKKQDDVGVQQPELPSKERSDAAKLLSDALDRSSSINNDVAKGNVPAASEKGLVADSHQPPSSPPMNTYTDAVKEFTTNATAFIEQLPLLANAREAYERAMKASSEMRKTLDISDQNLRTLMTQLEQKIDLQELKPATDKKPPEPAKVETMKCTGEGEGRAYRWP